MLALGNRRKEGFEASGYFCWTSTDFNSSPTAWHCMAWSRRTTRFPKRDQAILIERHPLTFWEYKHHKGPWLSLQDTSDFPIATSSLVKRPVKSFKTCVFQFHKTSKPLTRTKIGRTRKENKKSTVIVLSILKLNGLMALLVSTQNIKRGYTDKG